MQCYQFTNAIYYLKQRGWKNRNVFFEAPGLPLFRNEISEIKHSESLTR